MSAGWGSVTRRGAGLWAAAWEGVGGAELGGGLRGGPFKGLSRLHGGLGGGSGRKSISLLQPDGPYCNHMVPTTTEKRTLSQPVPCGLAVYVSKHFRECRFFKVPRLK